MESQYSRIILVTDGSSSSRAAEQTAFNLAKEHSAKVLIVSNVKPPTFVSQMLNSNAEDVFNMVVNSKEKSLEQLAGRFEDAGMETGVKVLVGNSSEQIAISALSWGADLVVRYMKGVRSRHYGPFGNTARNLMRICPCPLLLVGNKPVENPRVMACINAEHGSAENQSILSEAEKLAGPKQNLLALYCWKFYGGESLSEHMDDELFMSYMNEAERNYQGLFEQFRTKHNLDAFKKGVHFENGDPIQLIPEFCEREKVDVAVMSSASQDHPLLRLLGSTIESILNKLPCALLIVKPIGFKSHLKAPESTVEIENA